MAPSHSKLLPPALRERTIRSIVSQLTQMYLSNRTRISRAVYLALFVALINRVRHAIAEQKAASARDAARRAEQVGTTSTSAAAGEEAAGKRKRVELNREFFRSLLRLLRIVVPGWRSKETRLLISHSFFLVVRTLISLKVAAMDGAIVKSLVKGNGREFLTSIVWWMLIAMPATFTNSMVGLAVGWISGPLEGRRSLDINRLIILSLVVIPPSRALVEVPNTPDTAYSRQVPFRADLLRTVGS